MNEEMLRDVIGKVAALRAEMTITQRAFEGLAIALAEKGILSISDLLSTLKLIQAVTHTIDGPEVAEGFRHIITSRLEAVADLERPSMGLAFFGAMNAVTPEHQREALSTWLAQATPDEQMQTVEQLLDQLRLARQRAKERHTGGDESQGDGT